MCPISIRGYDDPLIVHHKITRIYRSKEEDELDHSNRKDSGGSLSDHISLSGQGPSKDKVTSKAMC